MSKSPRTHDYVRHAMTQRLPVSLHPARLRLASVLEQLQESYPAERGLLDDAAAAALGHGPDPNDQALEHLVHLAHVCHEDWTNDRLSRLPAGVEIPPAVLLAALLGDPELPTLLEKCRRGDVTAAETVALRVADQAARAVAPWMREAPVPSLLSVDAQALPSPADELSAGRAASPVPTAAPVASALASLPKVRVFASSAALVFELDQLREAVTGHGSHTLRIEGARSAERGGFDWTRKIAVQLAGQELPCFVATVMGWRDPFEIRHHGRQRDKSLRVRWQNQGLYVDLRQGRAGAAAPVCEADRYALAMLCADVLGRNHPGVGAGAALDVLRQIYSHGGSQA